MTHFPLFFDLKDKKELIFGGGAFTLQRIEKLKPFSPRITVISQKISDPIKQINGITWEERSFCEKDLDIAPAFVIIAEDKKTTATIYAECKKRQIPVNAVDMPEFCDIIFPSVVSTEHFCIGISSGGISPTATVEFKERIENMLPDNLDAILEWMLPLRDKINNTLPKEKRKSALRQLFNEALTQNRPLKKEEIEITVSSM